MKRTMTILLVVALFMVAPTAQAGSEEQKEDYIAAGGDVDSTCSIEGEALPICIGGAIFTADQDGEATIIIADDVNGENVSGAYWIDGDFTEFCGTTTFEVDEDTTVRVSVDTAFGLGGIGGCDDTATFGTTGTISFTVL